MIKEKSTFRERLVMGVRWSLLRRGGEVVLAASLAIVMARLLGPEEFGLVAMATVFTGISNIFVELGTGEALIRRKKVSDEFSSSIFWFTTTCSVLVATILIVVAPFIASLYGEAVISKIIYVLCIGIVLSGVARIPQAILEREMRFKAISISRLCAAAVGGVICISAALFGLGFWSIVISMISSSAIYALVITMSLRWRPQLVCKFIHVKEIFSVSLYLTSIKIMDHVQRKGEVLIVSLALGAAGSGVYSKAQVLSRAPVKVLSGVLAPVLFPAMSGVKTDIGHLKSLYLKALQSMALVSVPLGLLIGIFSEPIILFLLGLQWAETAHLAPIFGFLLLWTPITKCSSVVLKATGHIKPLVYGYACFTVVTIIGCSYAVVYGLVGIALSVLTTTFLLAIGLSILACRAIGVSGREFLGSLAVVYACGFVMGVVGLSCNFFLSESIIGPHLMGSVIGSLLSSVAYLICLSVRTVDAVHVLAELFGLSNRFGVGNGRNV